MLTKVINHLSKKINGQIILLLAVVMVMGNNHDGNHNTETTDTRENGKNDDTMEEETNSNKLSIVAWNIRCNNKELPEVEKEAIKRQWDIVFISETGLIFHAAMDSLLLLVSSSIVSLFFPFSCVSVVSVL